MKNQLKKFPNDNVTCISPWYELRIDANGSMRGCHAISQDYAETSNLSFLDWFNQGNEITNIRNSIIDGNEYPSCKSCYKNEEQNLISFRQRRNIQAAIYSGEYFQHSLEQSPAYKRMTGNVEKIYPAFMHVTLSNLCNLSCRMCFPNYSTQLSSLYKKIDLMDVDKPTLLDWTIDDNKWNEFLELIKNNNNLTALHFMGGEPLYHKRFIEFIDWCIDNNKTDFYLTFVTNGTIYDSRLLEKLQKFKSIQIEVSIENLHNTNDYIRLNGIHSIVKDNILAMKEKCNIVLRSVPQALSVLHYDTLIDFAIENNISIDSNVLSKPEYLKCFVLPKEIKDNLTSKIRAKYADILSFTYYHNPIARIRANDMQGLKKHIESVLIQINEQEPNNIEELRYQFVEYNNKMDSVSKFEFTKLYPELLNFYAKYSTI